MDMPEISEFLKENVPLFGDFALAEIGELVQLSRVATFEVNEPIVEFGEEGSFLGVLIDGTACASTTDDSGQKHIISTLQAGDMFGEMSMMTGDRTMADIVGASRCTALLIPQAVFSAAVMTHLPAVKILSKTISERLKARAADSGSEERAAAALRKSADPYGFNLKTLQAMKILVINCGSSSLKYHLFDTGDDARTARGMIERIGDDGTCHRYRSGDKEVVRELPVGGHAEAMTSMVAELTASGTGVIGSLDQIAVVGHRVVHGGDKFANAVVITDDVLRDIADLSDLAPLHNPVNIEGINEARRLMPDAPHVAVFDTSFHHTLPPYAYLYGLPYEYYEKARIRRYGFHGMSHSYVSLKAAEFVKRPYNQLEIVTCHLGNGASMCAVDHGRSIDTSMGLTPTEGLIMGTRCGDVDPAALTHIMKLDGLDADGVEGLINKRSGLKGISGISNDMREVQAAAAKGDHRAMLASKTFCYRIRKYIGSYMAAMGGLDVLVFTGGIGEGSPGVRSMACQGLACMGIHLDEEENRKAGEAKTVCLVSTQDSPVQVLVVPTDEERMIARETLRTLDREQVSAVIRSTAPEEVPIEVSAHHIHLSAEHVEALFGEGHDLTPLAKLSQPGQFACEEQVALVGAKGRVERVRVLGPARNRTQIEISMTEQFKLGIQPPIRASGDTDNSPGITLEGTAGSVATENGVICALRHIHMTPEDALRFGLHDKDMVRIRVEGARELIFGDVLVRVHPDYKLAMHIDTDEANAASIRTGMVGFVDSIQSRE